MQKAPHRKSRSFMASRWLSTARSTLRLAPFDGQVFSARNPGSRAAHPSAHRLEGEPRGDSRQPPAAPTGSVEGRFARAVAELHDTSAAEMDPNRVMFFAPGPVTHADLMRENRARAHHIRRRHRRRLRYEWLTANVGVIMAVLALFALVWFVSDR
ncbi:MAG TPA: hypothetical protein VKT27_01090 [Candidatus Binataceae bacterium]|nr:hypothetical protein [Candidatus Binataceae bacterium]